MAGTFVSILKWIGITLVVLVVVGVTLLMSIDPDRLREPLSNTLSQHLGRRVSIDGPLHIAWSWTPRISIEKLRIANAPWAKAPEFFTLTRADAALGIGSLLKGRLVIPTLELQSPKLALESRQDGKDNWTFDFKGSDSNDPTGIPVNRRWFPKVGRLAISNGHLEYKEPTGRNSVSTDVSTVLGESDERILKLEGDGHLQGQTLQLSMRGGSLLTLWETDKPFPVDLHIRYGGTELVIRGSLMEPLRLTGLDLEIQAKGPDLAVLRPFTRAFVPKTQRYHFTGKLRREAERWQIRDFDGKLGDSDMIGQLTFTVRNGQPYLQGELESRHLDFRDFAGFIGANPDKEAPPGPRFFPSQPLPVEGFRAADADIRFTSANIVTPYMPLDKVTLHIKLNQGRITIDPMDASIGLGRIASRLSMDAREDRLLSKLDATIDKVPFKRLLAKTPFVDETAGTFYGRMNLAMAGNSVAEMAGSADGGIILIMNDGRISGLLMEAIGLDILEALGIALAGDDPALPIRCSVNDFILTNGKMKTRLFLTDTTDTKLLGDGEINLGTERLNLHLSAHPKDVSLLSARTPISVGGTLKSPELRPESGSLAARAAASVGLGLLAGPAAIIPWIELGLEKDSACQTLLNTAAKEQDLPKVKPKKTRSTHTQKPDSRSP